MKIFYLKNQKENPKNTVLKINNICNKYGRGLYILSLVVIYLNLIIWINSSILPLLGEEIKSFKLSDFL